MRRTMVEHDKSLVKLQEGSYSKRNPIRNGCFNYRKSKHRHEELRIVRSSFSKKNEVLIRPRHQQKRPFFPSTKARVKKTAISKRTPQETSAMYQQTTEENTHRACFDSFTETTSIVAFVFIQDVQSSNGC